MAKKKGRVGSTFERYLAEQGTLEETRASAVKRVLAWQLKQAMQSRQMSKSAMARAMHTSRSQLDRILDPDNDHVRLDTLDAAARTVGLNLRIDASEWRQFDDRTARDRSVGAARRAETKARCASCWGPVAELKDSDGRWICIECRLCGRAVHAEEAEREAERMQREAEDNIPGACVGRGAVYHEKSMFVLKVLPDMDRDRAHFDQRVAAAKTKRNRLGRQHYRKGAPGYLYAQARGFVSGLNNLPREKSAISPSDFDFGKPQIVGIQTPTTGGPVQISAAIPVTHRQPSNDVMMERMGTAMIAGMSAAFACEVGMKAILLTRLDDAEKTHDLLKLFEALPKDSRERLEADFAEIGQVLRDHRHTFGEWRYFEQDAEGAMAALVHSDRVWGLGRAARVIIDECVVAGLQYDIDVNANIEYTADADHVSQSTQIDVQVTGHESAISWDTVLAAHRGRRE